MPERIVIATIGSYLDHGYGLWVSCNVCRHQAKLDLERLAETLGMDYDLSGADNPLRKKLQCAAFWEVGKVSFSVYGPSDPSRVSKVGIITDGIASRTGWLPLPCDPAREDGLEPAKLTSSC